MSVFDSNRILWAAVLISLGTAYYTVPSLLRTVKDAARSPQPDPVPPARQLQKESENSLKIETLRALADGHSYDLRSSAIKIVAYRTIRTSTKDLLLRDLASKDYVRRDNAINALWMLLFHARLNTTCFADAFSRRRGIEAVVEALIQGLPAHDKLSSTKRPSTSPDGEEKDDIPPSPLKPNHRPAHEASLLIILNHLLNQTSRSSHSWKADEFQPIDHAVRAGLVDRWLAKYPFPCSLPENEKFGFVRSDVARLCERSSWGTDDPLMADIVKAVVATTEGQRALCNAGLRRGGSVRHLRRNGFDLQWQFDPLREAHRTGGDPHGPNEDNVEEDHDVAMTDGEDTAGVPLDRDNQAEWLPLLPRPRSAERSQEEEHLRRRHREAVVVAERGTPLRRENILQRENSQFGFQPMAGVSEVEGVLNNLIDLSDSDGAELIVHDQSIERVEVLSSHEDGLDPMEQALAVQHTVGNESEEASTDHDENGGETEQAAPVA
ncbi:hypothetical protein LTR84_004536 [Exophiala bonariae]|uniref:Uncharacterized protein n=1 Tax=Exophiala bonariae TaxID=1690606 RepID=A0AAV9NQY5_9EURO|nr:hypothetical protein LTR84_004536 [Exophiala bonariae]